MTEQSPITEQPEDRPDDTDPYEEIIDYYARLAAQHAGRCVYHAPNP
jgi:hypothetical protein